jgi:molybdenum cofactor synthesis domain-containing protein
MPSAMRPFQSTISIDEARRLIDEAVRPIERVERVSLLEARGRVLATPVIAASDVPPFSRAAMDGYAVVAADLERASAAAPVALECLERVFTGQVPTRVVVRGTCAEVATGAPMPDGADAVVMVEETTRADDESPHGHANEGAPGDSGTPRGVPAERSVRFLAAARAGQNIGRRGQDIQAGQVAVSPGAELNASRIGALAALGLTAVDVYEHPRVAILATGNEIVSPGAALQPGQLYDINSFTLSTVVAEQGCIPLIVRTAADTIEDLTAAIESAPPHDVLVTSGGTSVGTRDLVMDVLRERGTVIFHGIAVKPGKPTAFGRLGRALVFGMPGYPTSCLSNAYILLAPALRRLARVADRARPSLRLPLAARVVSTTGRHQFYTVRVANGTAVPAFKASGDITSMSQADGYIEIDADTEVVEAGTLVDVKFF